MYEAFGAHCSYLSMIWDPYKIFKNKDHDSSSFVQTQQRQTICVKANEVLLNWKVVKFYFLCTSKQKYKLTFLWS